MWYNSYKRNFEEIFMSYTLEQNRLSKSGIEEKLSEKTRSLVKIEYYDTCDSTNRIAKTADISSHVTVFVANGQTAGRGRLGRSFHSASGTGIYMSLLYKPSSAVADALFITRYAAVKLARAIESLSRVDCKIKWVNDLYINGKKVAGILTEGVADTEHGGLERVVLGVGINVCHTAFPDELATVATSIEDECGKSPDREQLAAKVIEELVSDLSSLCAPDIVGEYRERSCLIGRRVTVTRAGESYPAEVVDIADSGALVIRTEHGLSELITGDVSIRPI